MLLPVAFCLALSAASCWILLRALIPKLSRRLLDQPNARSSHRQPTPRGGGLAFVVVSAGSSLLAFVWAANTFPALPQSLLPLAALPLGTIGLLDDRLNLPASWRYGAQLLTASLILWLSPISLPWQMLPLVIVFLGAVFAGLVLQAPSWQEAMGLLLVATPLLGDACLCVPRRLLAGQRVFQAHRLHLFQRLHQAGWPHARVSTLYIAATAVLALALLWGGLPWLITLAAFQLLLGIWLDQRVAVPFAIASRS
ncbi:glycosyl transferase [Synechococcus lacustris str. Tous]|uniref:Glycosyl transferase n=1 Tax=Synechococcus lacustris str. Tous TaxID=1910958 RepID=A0A2P7EBH2_9SYNE|nr:glycosyl transferase [Synechococcus lacustris str. Tous]